MRNAHQKYICYPSVVCAGVETEVTVFPHDISRYFKTDCNYELAVIGLRDDMVDYFDPIPFDIPYKIEGGCLKFRYTFEREEEYSIRFREKDSKNIIKVPLYAVKEDLWHLRPLKGDLHCHSYYSDGKDGVFGTPADYREEGFDFYALTDHNRMYPSLIQKELYEGVDLGICMIQGEEVHTPGSAVHIVHIGGCYSVCEKYVKERKAFEKAVAEIEATLPESVPEIYRYRFASAIWACREIKNAGGISIFAHPFWMPNVYNVSEDLCELLFDAKIFDVFELLNDGLTHRDNMQIALWQDQALKGNLLPVVGSSDTHNHDFETSSFGRSFTIVFAKENSPKAIMEAVKKGLSVACEVPRKDDSEVRVYGHSYRLVAFARFLYDNYFNETYRLCVGEGALMRRYSQGQDVGDILSALANSVADFYKKYYGITPAPVLPEKQLQHLGRLRKAQQESGIITRGSKLHLTTSGGRNE